MLRDIGHPFHAGEPLYDITFENVQAGERTSHLFRLANFHNGLVLGTGDLSELALGWATYGVGDQMSHYNVNASVPKTLIQYLLRWVIATKQFSDTASDLDSGHRGHRNLARTRPALGRGRRHVAVPIDAGEDRPLRAARLPRLLHHPLRLPPLQSRLPRPLRLGRQNARLVAGPVPRRQKERVRPAHDQKVACPIPVFRFFQTSQFKRSAMPNGPKVGSGGSLSPRGDWRAPSDSEATVWLKELAANVPD